MKDYHIIKRSGFNKKIDNSLENGLIENPISSQ
jgi:hypothetical protein